jgi:hypothetical protein
LENKKLHQQNKKLIERTKSLGAQVGHLRNQKSQHISEIRSLVQKSSTMSNAEFKSKINSLFMKILPIQFGLRLALHKWEKYQCDLQLSALS